MPAKLFSRTPQLLSASSAAAHDLEKIGRADLASLQDNFQTIKRGIIRVTAAQGRAWLRGREEREGMKTELLRSFA